MNAFALWARNNAWTNAVLAGACEGLSPAEYGARRTGFFPSIRATWNHLHAVDRFYIDALDGGGRGHRVWDDVPDFATAGTLRPAQAAQDARLIVLRERLTETAAARPLDLDRGPKGMIRERVDLVLWHLFQHQIHHRGQIHAMLAGTAVAPPQLDEFFLPSDRNPTNPFAATAVLDDGRAGAGGPAVQPSRNSSRA